MTELFTFVIDVLCFRIRSSPEYNVVYEGGLVNDSVDDLIVLLLRILCERLTSINYGFFYINIKNHRLEQTIRQ